MSPKVFYGLLVAIGAGLLGAAFAVEKPATLATTTGLAIMGVVLLVAGFIGLLADLFSPPLYDGSKVRHTLPGGDTILVDPSENYQPTLNTRSKQPPKELDYNRIARQLHRRKW